jgi:hypothetical protein
MLENMQRKYAIIETESNVSIIIDNKKARSVITDIIKRNNIQLPYSEDVAQWLMGHTK